MSHPREFTHDDEVSVSQTMRDLKVFAEKKVWRAEDLAEVQSLLELCAETKPGEKPSIAFKMTKDEAKVLMEVLDRYAKNTHTKDEAHTKMIESLLYDLSNEAQEVKNMKIEDLDMAKNIQNIRLQLQQNAFTSQDARARKTDLINGKGKDNMAA